MLDGTSVVTRTTSVRRMCFFVNLATGILFRWGMTVNQGYYRMDLQDAAGCFVLLVGTDWPVQSIVRRWRKSEAIGELSSLV